MKGVLPLRLPQMNYGLTGLKRLAGCVSARFHIALGLTAILTTLILSGYIVGFVPDKLAEQRVNRVQLSETLASSGSVLLKRGDLDGIRRVLEFVIERNEDVLGVGLHREWNNQNLQFGEVPTDIDIRTAEQQAVAGSRISVPLLRSGKVWGGLTVYFTPVGFQNGLSGAWDVFRFSPFGFMLFAGLLGFPVIYFYLGRVLKQLDPKAAVPGRVRSALDSIAECLVVVDRKGQLVLANAAFSTLSGRTPESLLGESIDSLDWVDDDDGALDRPWRRALDSGESVLQAMAAYVDVEGRRRSFIVNCSPVLGAEDQVGGVLVSMDDVTRLEEQEAALREAMVLAEEASVAKSAFLSNMSHEIRTPLTAILGFAEMLRRGGAQNPDDQARHLQTITNSGTHLLGLINDLLDLSKVESGAMEVEQIETEIASIAFDVAEVLRIKADEKGIELNVVVATDLPEAIYSDPSRIRQIITNLVGNAIKFTEAGTVQMHLSFDVDKSTYLISVVDSGIGMDEEQQARIFDAFSQADVTVTRRFGGTGLGLSISRNLAEALGGSITVESEPGKGSTFYLELPAGTLEPVTLLPVQNILDRVHSAQRVTNTSWQFPDVTVLVVDDASENRELLSLVLDQLGIAVRTASNGQEAVEAVAEGGLDAVLMDLQMPVMDGYQAAGIMRENGVSLPLVGLTADAMRGIEDRVIAAGFSHYQTKPINIDALTELLAQLLGGVKCESASDHAENGDKKGRLILPSGFSENVPATPIVSTLLHGDTRFRGIVGRFIPRMDEQLLTLRTAVESGDLAEVAATAHWLKGSGGNVGFDGFTKPAGALQDAAQSGDVESLLPILNDIDAYAARVRDGWTDEPGDSESDATDDQRLGT